MKTSFKKNIKKLVLVTCLSTSTAFATHNVNRYFPFLERPEEYTIKHRSHISPSVFYVTASTANRRGGSTGGIYDLWGRYDLKDVVASLRAVQPAIVGTPQDPFYGYSYLDGKSIAFRVDGKMQGQGLMLNWEQNLGLWGFQVGASIPVMSVSSLARYSLNRPDSDPIFNTSGLTFQQLRSQELIVDQIRRLTHQAIGFGGNEWEKGGVGDLDMHLRWNHIFDHVLLMRSIDINFQLGAIAPTGILSDNRFPPSLSVGSNGHWGLYGDFLTALELKQDLTVGILLGGAYLFSHTRNIRLSVGSEPTIFSALIGNVRMRPGGTFKCSAYLTLANLTDGLDFQVRYTYLRHGIDRWNDARAIASQQLIPSYLSNATLISQKEDLSKWSSQYATLQLTYDTKEAMKNYKFKPVYFASFDTPIGGNGIAKTNQVNLGVELHF